MYPKLKKNIFESLQNNGWKLQNNHFYGHRFVLVAKRPFTPWYVLVTHNKNYEEIFRDISKKSKGFFWGYSFILVVIGKAKIVRDSFSILRNKGGGGNTIIVDQKKVHAEIPKLLLDCRFYTKQVKRILEEIV